VNPRQLIAGVVAYDDEGAELARGTGTFRKSEVELLPTSATSDATGAHSQPSR